MSIVYARRTEKFNAAHRLHNPERSDEWNQATFGKCNNPNWHGHNYTLEVIVAGEPDPETGFVIDLADLKKVIHDRIIDKCDHRNLNTEVDFMSGHHDLDREFRHRHLETTGRSPSFRAPALRSSPRDGQPDGRVLRRVAPADARRNKRSGSDHPR